MKKVVKQSTQSEPLLQAKITKTELVDMIVYEQQTMLRQQKADLEAQLDKVLPSSEEFGQIQLDIVDICHKDFIAKNKAFYGTIDKIYDGITLSNHSSSKPEKYSNETFNSVKVRNMCGKTTGSWSMPTIPTTITIYATHEKGQKAPAHSTTRAITIHKKYEAPASVIKLYEKAVKFHNAQKDIQAAIVQVNKDIAKLETGRAAAKAKITRVMLESCEEGQEILGSLNKLKLEVSKEMLLLK